MSFKTDYRDVLKYRNHPYSFSWCFHITLWRRTICFCMGLCTEHLVLSNPFIDNKFNKNKFDSSVAFLLKNLFGFPLSTNPNALGGLLKSMVTYLPKLVSPPTYMVPCVAATVGPAFTSLQI